MGGVASPIIMLMTRYGRDFVVIFLTINTARAHRGHWRVHWVTAQYYPIGEALSPQKGTTLTVSQGKADPAHDPPTRYLVRSRWGGPALLDGTCWSSSWDLNLLRMPRPRGGGSLAHKSPRDICLLHITWTTQRMRKYGALQTSAWPGEHTVSTMVWTLQSLRVFRLLTLIFRSSGFAWD